MSRSRKRKPPRPHTAGADRLGDAGIDLRLVVGAKTQGAGPDIGQYDDDGSVGAAGGGKIVVQSPRHAQKPAKALNGNSDLIDLIENKQGKDMRAPVA